jgi:putative serine protease PepD
MTTVRTASAAIFAAATLTLAGCSSSAAPPTATAATAPATARTSGPVAVPDEAAALQQAYTSVVQRVLPSVVQITTDKGLGSGVVLDTRGNIVTNAHVVGDATTFQVRLAGSPTPAQATLKGAYRPDDLAVITLQQPPADLHPATFGDSAKLTIGDIVLAMGNPLGLTGSVTNGIVSATGRVVSEPTEGGSPGATLPDVIQTSAAINPGNSGGALVDLSGAVIGIPTLAALEPSGGGAGPAPGIGLAIPSNIVTDIAGQIVKNGHVVNSHRAALGVGVITVVDQNGQPAGAGVGVVEPDGAAAAAGIQTGDVITAINGTPVRSAQELTAALAVLDPGQKVPVEITDRQGAHRTLTVALGQLPGTS